ncbi:MAG: hypothetical protein ACLGH4_04370 [Actinomycetes bacterium]
MAGSGPGGAIPGRPPGSPTYVHELAGTVWVVSVSGLVAGLVIGILLRAAMFVLRLASPGSTGLISDDGFEVGRVTVFGVYNLVMLGVALGILGAAAYVAVHPFLLGPRWVRRLTVGFSATAIGGAANITDGGVDFTLLNPQVGVALFLLVPFLAGLLVSAAVDRVGGRARRPTWLPLLILAFPLAALFGAFQVAVIAALLPVRRALLDRVLASTTSLWVVRGLFGAIPVAACVALVPELRAVL